MDDRPTLAYEIYADLKRTCRRRKRIIFLLSAVIILLTALLTASPTIARAAQREHRAGTQERIIYHEFTEPECERFRSLCNFTDEERKVFDMRVKGRSNVDISMRLNMSVRTVERRIHSVKRKIIKVL